MASGATRSSGLWVTLLIVFFLAFAGGAALMYIVMVPEVAREGGEQSAKIVVDSNVVGGTAQAMIYGEITAPGVTTVIIPADKTVVLTQRQTVTTTITISTYQIIYGTTTHLTTVAGGQTVMVPLTTTLALTVIDGRTITGEAPTRTIATTQQELLRSTITERIPSLLIGAAVVLAALLTIIYRRRTLLYGKRVYRMVGHRRLGRYSRRGREGGGQLAALPSAISRRHALA